MHVYLLCDSRGSPERSKRVGTDGPKISVSRIPALYPSLAKAKERFAATVLLPTPPFADDTAMTLSTPVIFLLTGFLGQFGGVPERGRPYIIEPISASPKMINLVEGYQWILMAQRIGGAEQAPERGPHYAGSFSEWRGRKPK